MPSPTQSDQSPYTPPSLPEIQVPATPAPIQQPQPPQPPQGPQLAPGRPGSKAAGIGYMASNIVKGFAQARQQAQIRQAAQMGRSVDGMKFAYQTAKDKLRSLVESGADPNSQEVKEARAGRDSSWAAMMYLYSKYFEQGGQKPKGGSKGKQGQQGEQENPLAMLASPDRHVRAKGWYQLMLKLGPSDEAELRQYQSAPAKQARELQQGEAQSALELLKKKLDLHRLESLPNPTDEQKGQLARLKSDPELFPALARQAPHYASFDTPGTSLVDKIDPATGKPYLDAFGGSIDPKSSYREETVGEVRSYIPSTSKSQTKPIRAFSMKNGKPVSVEIDPKTNQIIPGTENDQIAPPAGMLEHVRTGEFSWKDDQGQLHRTQTTTTTTPVIPNAGRGGGVSHSTLPHEGGGHTPLASTLKNSTPGDRIIGSTGPTGQTKSRADAADSVLKLLPKAKAMLNDPDVRKNLGALSGRWSEIEKKIGSLDPKTQEFYGTLKSIYALNGAMHGWRSIKAPEEFEKAYGNLSTDPDTLLGGLRAVEGTAKDVYETGYKRAYSSDGGGEAGAKLTPEQEKLLDQYFPK